MDQPPTVLVVEDHPGVMALAVAVLEHAGWGVVQATTAREARTRLGEAAVDVVLSDVGLPGGTGEVPIYPADVRGHRPGVVYMSGDTARAAVHGQPGTDRALFLQKPFEPAALLGALAVAASRI